MKVVHEKGDFYTIHGLPDSVRGFVKFAIPGPYRYYDPEPHARWVVHRKYLIQAMRLASESGTEVVYDLPTDLQHLVEQAKQSWRNPTKDSAYSTLFLTRNAPAFMIDAAWKALALEYHPDRGGDPEKFRAAKEAYEELKNDGQYDGASS